jgi:hypothetical protein
MLRVAIAIAVGVVVVPALRVGPVRAASYSIVTNPPCSPSGSYAATSYGSNPGEKAHLAECFSGGYWYVTPSCDVQAGSNSYTDAAEADFRECYVFVWSGSTYVTRWGFANLATYPGPNNWSGWYVPGGGVIKLSGYTVSSEVCGTSWWYPGTYWGPDLLPCTQSPTHSLGS